MTCTEDQENSCPAGVACQDVDYVKYGNADKYCKEELIKSGWDYSCYDDPNNPNLYKVSYIENNFLALGLTQEQADDWVDWLTSAKALNLNDSICIFKPRVQVLDNWGWCSGSCELSSPTNPKEGCYSDNIINKCDVLNSSSWLSYSNIIVVAL